MKQLIRNMICDLREQVVEQVPEVGEEHQLAGGS